MITELKINQIFVFGSNLAGNHAGGAAKQALYWGAQMGVGVGRSGSTYALPTLDSNFEKLSLSVIRHYLWELVDYAVTHPEYEFLLTKVGQGIAGFSAEEIEINMPTLPPNIIKV